MTNLNIKKCNRESGFIAADFLFAFTLVIGCGLIIFALTFSLMTVEIAQYMTWSAARSYSSAQVDSPTHASAGIEKFTNLSNYFPLLSKADSNWFLLRVGSVGINAWEGMNSLDPENQLGGQSRQPWTGFSSILELQLFKSLNVPFLGKVVADEEKFDFRIRAFMLRNPSRQECMDFMKNRYTDGIKTIDDLKGVTYDSPDAYVPVEDNGC